MFTLWEYPLTLLRLDERARAYFTFTIANVLVDDPGDGLPRRRRGRGRRRAPARQLRHRRRLPRLAARPRAPPPRARPGPRRCCGGCSASGCRRCPPSSPLYSLNFIDRILIVRLAGLAEAGLYALAIKFAQGVNVLVRGFQLAWPPLAYSIADDDEARRAYALIVTWFAAVCAFVVVGLWLLSRWIVDLLAAPEFFESYEAIGLLATGVALYALYLVLVVILGRTGRPSSTSRRRSPARSPTSP